MFQIREKCQEKKQSLLSYFIYLTSDQFSEDPDLSNATKLSFFSVLWIFLREERFYSDQKVRNKAEILSDKNSVLFFFRTRQDLK